jgi:hypothetical protein
VRHFGGCNPERAGAKLMSKQSDLVSVSQGASGDPLFIDTANNRVGVGTSSPVAPLHVAGTSRFVSGGATTPAITVTQGYINGDISSANFTIGNFGDGSSEMRVGTRGFTTFFTGAFDNATGTERMRIDSAGHVTMPYQPAMHGKLTSTTTFNGGDLYKPDSVNVNIGNHYSSATGLFTAPVGGLYQISGTFLVRGAGSTGASLSVFPYYNGVVATSYGAIYQASFSTENAVAGVYLVPLSANDTLGLALTSSGTISLYGTENFMSIRFLG